MRRSIILYTLLGFLLLSTGCSNSANLAHLQRIHEEYQPIYNMYPIKAYCDGQTVFVIILDNGKVVKGASFSSDRVASYTASIDLISLNDIRTYLGTVLRDIENNLGRYHVDIGSGGFMPSYLTKDGYLLILSVNRDSQIVEHVGAIDLFTGESVESYFSYDE